MYRGREDLLEECRPFCHLFVLAVWDGGTTFGVDVPAGTRHMFLQASTTRTLSETAGAGPGSTSHPSSCVTHPWPGTLPGLTGAAGVVSPKCCHLPTAGKVGGKWCILGTPQPRCRSGPVPASAAGQVGVPRMAPQVKEAAWDADGMK